jgi:ATP:ADP antiporter, AAA family
MNLDNFAPSPNSPVSFFRKIRQFLWPIYGEEHRRFLPMMLMIAFIIFNYTVLRNIKDALIVTEAGAETIIFLKFWAVVPAAFIFFLFYSKVTNILSSKKVFYVMVLPFISFFALFSLFLYPNRAILHPVESADWLQSIFPAGLAGMVAIYRYWTFSIFYVLAELWGSVVLSLLFWQFANSVTPVTEAKRFYPHLYLLGNVANMLAGYVTFYFSNLGKTSLATDPWQVSLNYLMLIVVCVGLAAAAIHFYLSQCVFNDASSVTVGGAVPKKKKLNLSMAESFKFLFSSKYLGLIAVLVIAYGISINLVEVSWKNRLGMQYPDKNDYNAFMGMLSGTIGFGTALVILLGGSIIRKFGWKNGALATPYILGFTSIAFFACVIFPDFFAPIAVLMGTTPLMMAVVFGFAQNVLSKSTKYALFDPTKEMAYIPLDDESKSKGKAAVDVVGARLGKSGGSLLQQFMVAFIGPIGVIMPYSAVIVVVVVAAWIFAVYALNKRFTAIGGDN